MTVCLKRQGIGANVERTNTMRKPKTLSPSAFMLFEKDPTEYALRYITDNKPPRTPQALPASVGSAFDAIAKSNLHERLFGKGADPKMELDALFTSQVEEHNRDEAMVMGQHVFEDYVETGSFDELLGIMEDAAEAPEFEFDAGRVVDGVPLFGKPDCRFVDRRGNHVILDWKVRGYCSKYGASPVKGYQKCRDGADWPHRNLTKTQLKKREDGQEVQGKHSRSHGTEHKLYLGMDFNGLTINQGFLETCDSEWATQLSIYGWLMGEKVGDENVVVCIDEIVGKFMGEGNRPLLRVANHKARVSPSFQIDLHGRLQKLWDAIESGWIFHEISREENDEMLERLQHRARGMASDGSEEEDFYSQMGRPAYR